MKHVRGEVKYIMVLCLQQLYAGFMSSCGGSRHLTRSRSAQSVYFTTQKHTYLKVQPGMPKTNAQGRWSGVYLVCSLDFESQVSTTQLSQSVFNSRLSKENLATGVREQLVLCSSCWDIRSL